MLASPFIDEVQYCVVGVAGGHEEDDVGARGHRVQGRVQPGQAQKRACPVDRYPPVVVGDGLDGDISACDSVERHHYRERQAEKHAFEEVEEDHAAAAETG